MMLQMLSFKTTYYYLKVIWMEYVAAFHFFNYYYGRSLVMDIKMYVTHVYKVL